MKTNHDQAEDLLNQALEFKPEERAAFLAGACGSDKDLRARLETLLHAHDEAVGFLPEAQTVVATTKLAEGAGTVIGRYKLLQKIGEGGMGMVYMAEQEIPVRRRVALKIIKLGMDTRQVVARFEAERQALALMDHPNIAKVLDGGATDAGRPYFVMELVRGTKITEYCDQNNLSTRQRLDLFIKVCQAIQHAHQKGIIHRDIKPSNVLVTLHDGVPVPKVIDFGIAKATTDQCLTDKTLFTALEQFIGTPAYMSPEQAEMSGLDLDTRCDIYSLGVLLYELLTGQTPFDAKELLASGLDEMRRTIREKEPVRPSTKLSQELLKTQGGKGEKEKGGSEAASSPERPSLPFSPAPFPPRQGTHPPQDSQPSAHRLNQLKQLIPLLRGDVDWIVMKCLEKDRARRYETANGLAADIQRHLSNEAVLARPPSTAYRFQKAFRRNKLAFAAGGAVALALLIGMAASLWLAGEARRAQRTAQYQAYVATMNAVQGAWEQNHVSRVRDLLQEVATSPERGFEWYYWQRQMHLELQALRGHTEPILAVAYSPDGHQIVTGSGDKSARVWDADTAKELLRLNGHTAEVSSVAFSTNGQWIVSGSWDKTAKVWDAVTGRPLVTLEGHDGAIFSVACSPDGLRVVTGSEDKTARVWDAHSGKELLQFTNHTDHVLAVAFSSDGQSIVSGSWDKTAKVWDANTGEVLRTLIGHSGAIFSAVFSPTGQRILTGSQDSRVKVWDAVSGTNLFTLQGHSAAVCSVGYSRDGTRIISSGEDQAARVWNVASGEEIHVLKGHGSRIGSAAFSPDGQRIVTGGGAMQFEPTGLIFGFFGEDRTAKGWKIADSGEGTTLEGHTNTVSSVEFPPNGRMVASGNFDGTARLWDLGTRREVLKLAGHEAAVRSVAFFPDGRRLVTGSFDHTAKVWDLVTGKELLSLVGHTADIFSVAVSPDGRRIATGSKDHTAKVWDVDTGSNLVTLTGKVEWVWSVAFSPDGQRIVTGNETEDDAKVWDAGSGKELFSLKGHGKWVMAAVFSPDGQRIVTGSADGDAKVWDASSGKELLTLKGHSGRVMSVSYSPDSQRILTASTDQTAKLWDAETGKELLTFRGHTHWISSAAFSRDGQRIVTGSNDHTVKVWEAATPEQVSKWQQEERSAGIR